MTFEGPCWHSQDHGPLSTLSRNPYLQRVTATPQIALVSITSIHLSN